MRRIVSVIVLSFVSLLGLSVVAIVYGNTLTQRSYMAVSLRDTDPINSFWLDTYTGVMIEYTPGRAAQLEAQRNPPPPPPRYAAQLVPDAEDNTLQHLVTVDAQTAETRTLYTINAREESLQNSFAIGDTYWLHLVSFVDPALSGLRAYNIETGELVQHYTDEQYGSYQSNISPDNRYYSLLGRPQPMPDNRFAFMNPLQLVDLETGAFVEMQSFLQVVSIWSPDGKWLFSRYVDDSLQAGEMGLQWFNPQTGERHREQFSADSFVQAWSPDVAYMILVMERTPDDITVEREMYLFHIETATLTMLYQETVDTPDQRPQIIWAERVPKALVAMGKSATEPILFIDASTAQAEHIATLEYQADLTLSRFADYWMHRFDDTVTLRDDDGRVLLQRPMRTDNISLNGWLYGLPNYIYTDD